ncbi:beta-galactosidase [Arthrobacter sp. AFG7.2]|uniref:beta-galactosidase n=1 Tax=Arthrobacter sp. AFG7.2 TaxID=1688693 RepID=UPI000C9E0CA6|nr:beta-galactosidase [Arthrobacter sp. AFG7.2]PNI09459.1 beta-galactosidase [Arthrobacter sp. AFG7.2]
MSPKPLESFRQRLPGIIYGGDYNPEQWPRSTWQDDIRLMREANVTLVSLGVFSWSLLEPADGDFNFGWLDEVMDLLGENGILVNLATPNASPPPWLATDFPEALMVERDGTRVGVGSRGHFCPSSPVYRDRSQRMARQLAQRYGAHPALAMWHIGNEYHAQCFCDLCDDGFRTWLQGKHGSLDELNTRWGTTLWGQVYSDWNQVHLPRPVRGWVNPARELDFARFATDIQVDLYRQERDLLKSITPGIPATTNFVQFFRVQDYRRWAPETDVIALDIYPDPAKPASLVEAAMQYDLMRHLGDGKPWMMMEQAAGAVSQWKVNLPKQPGMMRLGSYQAIARGADAVMFFQWRASRFGQEKFHSAMLPHGGEASRTWQEVRQLGKELAALAELAGSRSAAEVAIVWDWENWWAVEGAAHPLNNYNYREVVAGHYQSLWRTNAAVDVVTLSSDLSRYKVLVIPNQYLMSPTQQLAVESFVEGGGHALVSYFSGIVDQDDQIIENGYPGGLRGVIGGHIRDFSPLAPGATVGITPASGQTLLSGTVQGFDDGASRWQDDLAVEGADVVAVYTDGYLAGRPAILDHRPGTGRAVYLGTHLAQEALDRVVEAVLNDAGIRPPHAAPEGVEVTERFTGSRRYLFFLNHSGSAAVVDLEVSGLELLAGRQVAVGESLKLEPVGVAVIRAGTEG